MSGHGLHVLTNDLLNDLLNDLQNDLQNQIGISRVRATNRQGIRKLPGLRRGSRRSGGHN
jgi:hypothetical protein